jgi:hypothetical protein
MDEKSANIQIGRDFVGDLTFGNKNVDSFNTYNVQERQALAEAAEEIQRLLKQLEETNPIATESEQVAYINVATKPDLKQRTIAALKEGGETAIDEFVLDNKYLKVVKAVAKGWLQPKG